MSFPSARIKNIIAARFNCILVVSVKFRTKLSTNIAAKYGNLNTTCMYLCVSVIVKVKSENVCMYGLKSFISAYVYIFVCSK